MGIWYTNVAVFLDFNTTRVAVEKALTAIHFFAGLARTYAKGTRHMYFS